MANCKNLEWSGRGLIEVLSRDLPGWTEESYGKPANTAGISAESRTKHFSNTSLQRYPRTTCTVSFTINWSFRYTYGYFSWSTPSERWLKVSNQVKSGSLLSEAPRLEIIRTNHHYSIPLPRCNLILSFQVVSGVPNDLLYANCFNSSPTCVIWEV
jgi:hypothetical protein